MDENFAFLKKATTYLLYTTYGRIFCSSGKNNCLSECVFLTKLLILTNMSLKETYRSVWVGSYLFVVFTKRNGLEKERYFITIDLGFCFRIPNLESSGYPGRLEFICTHQVLMYVFMVTYLTEDYMLFRKTLKLY